MKNKVIHYIDNYLALTTPWIYNQIAFNTHFRQVVFARKINNETLFPVEALYSCQRLSFLKKAYNNLIYKCLKYYPYYISIGKKVQANIIHAHFGNIAYKALKLKEKLHIPMVVTFYGYDISALPKRKKYRKRYKILFEKADLFLLEGSNMALELEKLGCPKEKIKVFHLGVDISKIPFRERNIAENEAINLLFVATLTEKKGCEYLIRAYAKVLEKYSAVRLKIIGQGELKEQLLDLAKSLNVFDKIQFEDYIPYSQFVTELNKADIFISPSVTAKNGNTEGGAPVSLIDAQAAGLAIISSFHADIPEVVRHGETGLLAEEKDYNTLAEHIDFFIKNPEQIKIFGKNGRQHIEQEYNILLQGEKLGKIYDEVISTHTI